MLVASKVASTVLVLQGLIDRIPTAETNAPLGEVILRATDEMSGLIPVGSITPQLEVVGSSHATEEGAEAFGLTIQVALVERTMEGTETATATATTGAVIGPECPPATIETAVAGAEIEIIAEVGVATGLERPLRAIEIAAVAVGAEIGLERLLAV